MCVYIKKVEIDFLRFGVQFLTRYTWGINSCKSLFHFDWKHNLRAISCAIKLAFENLVILINNDHKKYILFTGDQHHTRDSTKTNINFHTWLQYIGNLEIWFSDGWSKILNVTERLCNNKQLAIILLKPLILNHFLLATHLNHKNIS